MRGPVGGAIGLVRRLSHAALLARARRDFTRDSACRLHGLDLRVAPGVLHPGYFRSSRLLADAIRDRPLAGLRVLDVGTGSGVLALVAAKAGAQAVGLDISEEAVACATGNAARNGLSQAARFLRSDVFGALRADATFDLVVTNPPFYPRAAEGNRDHAFAAGEGHVFIQRLAAELPSRLAAGGALVMVHSSDVDFTPVAREFQQAGFEYRTLSSRRGFFETLTVREFARRR